MDKLLSVIGMIENGQNDPHHSEKMFALSDQLWNGLLAKLDEIEAERENAGE